MATLSIEVNAQTSDEKNSKEHTSLINILLPDLVKRRVGRMPSLRRALSVTATEKQEDVLPPSPPPPYAEPIEGNRMSDMESDDGDLARPLDVRDLANETIYCIANETSTSGVRWKHVSEGCRLVECAAQEATSETEDPDLTRKMYIDGVGYLLNALPELSPQESAQLADYLPASLRQTDDQPLNRHLQLQTRGGEGDEKNYVYRFMTIATMYGILFASLVLPFLERFVAAVYRCDQHYHISARVADTMTQTVSSVARKIFTSLNEGKSGQVALGMTLYTIEGASRGILNGYAQALKRQTAVGKQVDTTDGGIAEKD